MSRTHNFRLALDKKLDIWEQYLERLEGQASETKAETEAKLASAKEKLKKSIDKTKEELSKVPDLAKEKKEQLQALLDDLKDKLNEKTDEAKDKFVQQKDKITEAIHGFEEKAKKEVNQTYHKAIDEFGKLGNSLHAHLDALEHLYEVERAKKTEEFDEKKTAFSEKVKKWKATIHEKRNAGMDKLDTFEKEFMDGMQGVNNAFKNLFK